MRLVILYFFLVQLCFGQRDHFVISGMVTDEDTPENRIYGIKVRVLINDTLYRELDCDSLGRYSVTVFRRLTPGSEIFVGVRQDKELLSMLFPSSKECPNISKLPNQYFTKDFRLIEYKENTDFIADFSLVKMIIDVRMPCLCFRSSSTYLKRCCGDDPDTTIYCLTKIFLDNPTLVMEVAGTSWREITKNRIARRRAELVKRKWVSNGVDEQRIIISATRNRSTRYSTKEIRHAKTRKERRELKSQNRTISYKIIAFDYDPVRKQRVMVSDRSIDD